MNILFTAIPPIERNGAFKSLLSHPKRHGDAVPLSKRDPKDTKVNKRLL
jgi:hypothetical protein